MKIGSKVSIDFQDGDFGSIVCEGIIISRAPKIENVPARYCVEYNDEKDAGNFYRKWFYESDLREIK